MLLPKPYPDELFSSVVARAAHHTGLGTKVLLRAIFGSSTRTAIPFLMATEVRRLARLAGIESEELVLRHTVFPYSVAFMPEQARQQLLAKVLDRSSSEECISTLAKSVSFGIRYRRVCPACIRQDLHRYGETFWRRAHLLPGVLTCWEHGVPLLEAPIPVKRAANTNVLRLPSQEPTRRRQVAVDESLEASVRRISLAAIDGQIPALQSWAEFYRQEVIARGFLLASGDVASGAFARHFTQCFGYDYLADLGYLDSPNDQLKWPALMVRGEVPPFASTKHVLMHAYLQSAAMPAQEAIKNVYSKPGKTPRDLDEVDRTISKRLAAVIKSVKASGERVTVTWLLEAVGARATYRHNSTRLPRTAALLFQFRTSDSSARQIGLRPSVRQRSATRAQRASEAKAVLEERLRQAHSCLNSRALKA
jgi:hypothetical protein